MSLYDDEDVVTSDTSTSTGWSIAAAVATNAGKKPDDEPFAAPVMPVTVRPAVAVSMAALNRGRNNPARPSPSLPPVVDLQKNKKQGLSSKADSPAMKFPFVGDKVGDLMGLYQ